MFADFDREKCISFITYVMRLFPTAAIAIISNPWSPEIPCQNMYQVFAEKGRQYHRANQVVFLLYAKKNLLLSLRKVNIQEKGNHEIARSARGEITHTKNKCRCSHATMLVGIGRLTSPINCNLFTHHTHTLSLGIISPGLHVHFPRTS